MKLDFVGALIVFGLSCAGLGWLIIEGIIWLFSNISIVIN